MKIRIKDIAQLAGVSEGTVDRVIHNRGEVSASSKKAVDEALKELNYSPNIFARSLASKKQYRFVALTPEYEQGDYWQFVDDGFDTASNEFVHYNVHVDKKYFNQFDASSFVEQANSVLQELPDAVILSPVFKKETLDFTTKLLENNVPVSFIDSMIEEADFLTYYGQNSFQSGYVVAKLLWKTIPSNTEILLVRTQRKQGAVSNQTFNRYQGFMQYIEEHKENSGVKLIAVELKDDDEIANLELIRQVLIENPNVKAGVTFNSKVYRLAMHLEAQGRKDIRLFGYDLLAKNVDYMCKDVISCLIAQRPEQQAYNSVRDLCKKIIFEQEISKINYMPIDILLKENIEYY